MDAIQKLTQLIRGFVTTRFFGKLVISFQNGIVSNIVIEQVKKLDEL